MLMTPKHIVILMALVKLGLMATPRVRRHSLGFARLALKRLSKRR
jgi:hypothetical protein